MPEPERSTHLVLASGGVCRVGHGGVRVLRVIAVVVLVRELETRLDVFVAGVVERSKDLDVGLLAIALVGEEPSRNRARHQAVVNRETRTRRRAFCRPTLGALLTRERHLERGR